MPQPKNHHMVITAKVSGKVLDFMSLVTMTYLVTTTYPGTRATTIYRAATELYLVVMRDHGMAPE